MENINILFEDNHIIVIDKPQNVPVQADSSQDTDLLTELKNYLKVTYNKPGDAYLGLVHRLDRPTGGVMVFAKTSKAASRLCEAIKEGDFEKRYFAVICGEPRMKSDRLTHYLKKNPVTNVTMAVPQLTDGAKKAVLQYKIIGTLKKGVSLAQVDLDTGRSHQIRVQMATIGNPVFGDVKYGGDKLAKGYNLALYSVCLKFTHPVTKQRMVFITYPPVDEMPWKLFETEIEKNLAISKPE
ncbi:MAG: RluA family pseudouridine synthase [Christensenellales bacterium]